VKPTACIFLMKQFTEVCGIIGDDGQAGRHDGCCTRLILAKQCTNGGRRWIHSCWIGRENLLWGSGDDIHIP